MGGLVINPYQVAAVASLSPVVASARTGTGICNYAGELVVTAPANTAAGNQLILIAVFNADAGAGITGWSGASTITGAGGVINVLDSVLCQYKILSGVQSQITMVGIPDIQITYAWFRITGAHASAAPEGGSATGTSTQPNPPSVTPSWGSAADLLISYAALASTSALSSYPTNYTDNQFANSSGDLSVAVATRGATVVSEDPGVFTFGTSRDWRAGTIAVRPA